MMNRVPVPGRLGAALALLLLVAACGVRGPSTEGPTPFVGGTEGLTMTFLEGSPPEEVFDAGQYPFSFTFIVTNVGEDDILPGDNAEVRIVGINPVQWGVTESDLFLPLLATAGYASLRGAYKLADGTVLPGDPATITPQHNFKYLPDLVGTQEFLLRGEICYDYKTRSTTKICLKDNVLDSIRNDKICTVNEYKTVYNSGSPVHVTSVKETPHGQDAVSIQFTVEHVGTGLIFKKRGGQECEDTVTNFERNYVKVDVYMEQGSNTQVNCPLLGSGGSGYVQLFQGAPRTLSCTLRMPGAHGRSEVFQDILHIDLEYTYLQFTERPIIVRDVTTGLTAR